MSYTQKIEKTAGRFCRQKKYPFYYAEASSAFSTSAIACFLIGIRQFLLLPNSTITSSSVISMTTTFYSLERDLSRLADILGHSSIVTIRIYTAESGAIHARQMGRLGLGIT